MQPFTQRVIEVIKSIPAGHVMTYGGVARAAGSPKGARQVVRILHSSSAAHQLPWHRVINAKGEIAIQDDESRFLQTLYLRDEGVQVDKSGRVDLQQYKFDPPQYDTHSI